MPTHRHYRESIQRWGLFARSILSRSELVQVFVNEGIKESELERVSSTENAARLADQAQKDASQILTKDTQAIRKLAAEIKDLFAVLRLRAPNAAADLRAGGDEDSAKALLAIEFSPKAPPRVPATTEEDKEKEKEKQEASAPKEEKKKEEDEEETEEVRETQESQAQKALATAAIRLEEYLRDKPSAVEALKARQAPATFMEDLKNKGNELIRLREERALALSSRKEATRAEYKAVKEHMEARKVIERTVNVLVTKNSDIDALAVEHLKRKPNFDSQQRKKRKKKKTNTPKKEATPKKKSA